MGFKDEDYRTALNLMSRWPDKTVPAGGDHIRLYMRFGHDMNDSEAAGLYAWDYRSPDRLDVASGELVTDDVGDSDGDGFNEVEGCYVLASGPRGVRLTIHGSKLTRTNPAFKIGGWSGPAPRTIALGAAPILAGAGFNVSLKDGVLLLQILKTITEDVEVSVDANRQRLRGGLS
jgi:hypothetical protein